MKRDFELPTSTSPFFFCRKAERSGDSELSTEDKRLKRDFELPTTLLMIYPFSAYNFQKGHEQNFYIQQKGAVFVIILIKVDFNRNG